MPIYECRCNRCNKEFSQLLLRNQDVCHVRCTYCRGEDLTRLLSSFRVHQTEASRLARFDPSKPQGDDFYRDSRNVGLWTKKRMQQMGVDLGPKLDEIVEKGRSGKILEDYEK